MSKPVEYRLPIDQALEETKYGRFNYFLIFVSGLILINVVMECIGINFVLPVTDCDLDLNYQEKGILAAAGFLGIITSSHLWGFLADTTGRRRVIRPTLIIGYFFTVISSLSPNFSTLLLFRYVNGFLISGGSATIFPYLGEFHSDRMRNRAIMSAGFICAAASLLYPIVAWAVINQSWTLEVPYFDIVYKPWRMYILVIGILGLFCGISLFYLPESPKYLLSIGKEEEVIEILRKMYSLNTGNPRESYKVTSILPDVKEIRKLKVEDEVKNCGCRSIFRSMWNQTAPLFMREHRRNTTVICFIIFWIFFTAHGILMWFPFVLNKVMQFTSANPTSNLQICEMLYIMDNYNEPNVNATKTEILERKCDQSLELSTYQHTLSLEAIFAGLYIGVGYFTGKLGRIRTLVIILMVCGIGGIFAATVTIPIFAVYSLQVLLVCGLGVTVLNSITVDIFPTNLRAMACCVSLMIGRIGSVFGTNFIGLLLEHHCQAGLLTASVALILNGFLALLLPTNIGFQKIASTSSVEG
ncbi:synaptic vesicle glycoprotein 2B-like [Eupeodes corollae]|uniref:synaptic vesicle glycoprotein 2B-like n=1 Tax=Eupeodes corollae TaxID=290404 RepID=UPI0024917682|nr:synaptic vesicle glycoprotein 2B-like [Eupeodes corollae]